MGKTPSCSVGSDDVLQVENKWPFLPITPTYDDYVQQSMAFPFPQREEFHVLTRSDMKELRSLVRKSRWFSLTNSRNVLSLRFEWMCGAERTIALRTEQREQGCEESVVLVCSTRTSCAGTDGHKPSPPTVLMLAVAFFSAKVP